MAYKENRNTLGTATFAKYDYSVNSIGQRIGVVESGQNLVGPGARDWSYNSSGELIGEDASGSIHDRGYRYDDLGNRLSSARSTTDPALATAGNLGIYKATVGGAAGANSLNQYGEVTLPGVATVPVVHDLDGNMTSGPLPAAPGQASSLAWDAENRLIEVGVGTAARQVQFRYDPIGRRIAKITAAKTELYMYDGWNLVGTYTADLTADSATLATAYTWGLDLSGSLQGAGGVGGLLAIHEQAGNGSAKAGQVIYPAYDGNGNIVRLLNSGGGVVASYAYDGFGNRLNPAASDIDSSGYADEQEFGFSTKFRDAETGLIYYGYRYYDPVTGRWPSRDPMGESLKLPIYSFVGNSPLSYFDLVGLQSLPADSNVGESGMGRFFGDDDDPNAGSTVTLCDRADALRVKIERLAKNDLRLGFLKTQHCILEKLCQKACCPSAAEWLENVIKDFMDPLFDALEGNPNEGWRKTFEQVGVYEAGNAGIEKTLSSVLVSSEARFELDQAKRMNEVMSARDMAITHISQDLRNALIRNGVGDDGDWKCIGDVVSECEKNEFTPLERGVSRLAGLIDASFDVGKFRDDMRDSLKQDGGSQ